MSKSFVFFIILLTVLKIFAAFSTNFSLFGDEAQYWLWSKKLDIGYLSKPPLISWMIMLHTFFFGDSFESLKLFPIFFYFFTAIAIYNFSQKLGLEKNVSVICTLTFLILPAVSLSSFLLSTDVILLFFWTISMGVLLDIRKNASTYNFFILGIVLGLAFLSKYAAVYFFICLFFILFFDNILRKILFSNKIKFVLFLLVFIVVVSPNILWNSMNDWLTLDHTSKNANLKNININFFRGFEFLLIQIFMIGPILFIGFIMSIKKISYDFENIFLLSFSVPILVVVFTEGVVVRANANWAAVALVSLFVFFVRSLNYHKNLIILSNFMVNYVFGVVLFLLISFSFDHKIFDRIIGIKEFSYEIKNDLGEISNIVVTDRLLYSSLSYEFRNQKLNFYMPKDPNHNITKHFQISSPLNKKMSDDFLLIGDVSDISYLENAPKVLFIKKYNPKFLSLPVKIYEINY